MESASASCFVLARANAPPRGLIGWKRGRRSSAGRGGAHGRSVFGSRVVKLGLGRFSAERAHGGGLKMLAGDIFKREGMREICVFGVLAAS